FRIHVALRRASRRELHHTGCGAAARSVRKVFGGPLPCCHHSVGSNKTVNKFKTLVLGTAMAVPFATTLLASASPANLIANGTFDSSVAGWDNFPGTPTPANTR